MVVVAPGEVVTTLVRNPSGAHSGPMTNHTETNSTDQLTGGTVANEGGATSPTVRTEIKAGNPGLVFQHSEAKGLKKSLAKTFAIAIAIATVGMGAIPVQSAQAAPGDGILEKCKKTGTSSIGGDRWTCKNIFGYDTCLVGAGGYYCSNYGKELRRDDIFGNPYDERDPAARHLLKLVQRDTRR